MGWGHEGSELNLAARPSADPSSCFTFFRSIHRLMTTGEERVRVHGSHLGASTHVIRPSGRETELTSPALLHRLPRTQQQRSQSSPAHLLTDPKLLT